MKCVAVISLQRPAYCSDTSPPSPVSLVTELGRCELQRVDRLLVWKGQYHFDNKLTVTDEDQRFPLPGVHPQKPSCAFFCQPSLIPPLFRRLRRNWKKPNVCLLSPILTSSLPPLCPSAPPVLAIHPVWTHLHTAVQRQSQRPQPHQLPQLFPWGVLPAADRTDQRDGEPGGQWPVAVCCEGPGVLHSGSEGRDVFIHSLLYLTVYFLS